MADRGNFNIWTGADNPVDGCMAQLQPLTTYPIRRELQVLVNAASGGWFPLHAIRELAKLSVQINEFLPGEVS
jgi:hypothetical protein